MPLSDILPGPILAFQAAQDNAARQRAQQLQEATAIANMRRAQEDMALRRAAAGRQNQLLEMELAKWKQQEADIAERKQFYSEPNLRKIGVIKDQPEVIQEGANAEDVANPVMFNAPTLEPKVDLRRLLEQSALRGYTQPIDIARMQSTEELKNAQLAMTWQTKMAQIDQREQESLRRAQTAADRMHIAAQAAADRNAVRLQIAEMNKTTNAALTANQRMIAEDRAKSSFENSAVIKRYEAIAPRVAHANSYMGVRDKLTSPERAAGDRALVNAFLSITHPQGDRITNWTRAELLALPNLPQRMFNAISSWFEGRHLPDDIAKAMHKVITGELSQLEGTVRKRQSHDQKILRDRGLDSSVIRNVVYPEISTQAAFDALPSGTRFIDVTEKDPSKRIKEKP